MSTQNLIADRSYRNYDGPMRTVRAGWWVIAQSVIRTNIRKIAFWMPVLMIVLIHLFYGLVFFFNHNLAQGIRETGMGGGRSQTTFTYASCIALCLSEGWLRGLLVFIQALVIGAGAIAADNQANALLVYLSRPLTKTDYLVGKWFGVFLLLWCTTVIPALLVYTFLFSNYSDEGFLKQNPYLLPRLLLASLVPAVLNASLVIGISSWFKSGRMAGATYAGFYFVIGIITFVAGSVMARNAYLNQDNDDPNAKATVQWAMTLRDANVGGITEGLAMNILHVRPQDDPFPAVGGHKRRLMPPHTWPLVALGGMFVLLPLAAAYKKVRAVEIISG
jgi:ABC-2 type transport system permease protein